jgi:tRNA G18 (ribose-2'-O)-methylase SpoU
LHNIGSVFRTADAFLIENILMWYYCHTSNKEIHKTALGATETVVWEHYENVITVIEKLKADDVMTLAIEQVESAVFLQNFEIQKEKKYALVLETSSWCFTRSSCLM